MKLKLGCAFITILLITGCVSLPQNQQIGNNSGQIKDNRWDYFAGTPVRYTSTSRTVSKEKILVTSEVTDSFSATLNAPRNGEKASLLMNGVSVVLNRLEDDGAIDAAVSAMGECQANKNICKQWSQWYASEDKKYLLAIEFEKQILLTSYIGKDGSVQNIAYYPSRYLACKKIAQIKAAKDTEMAMRLIKTALVAGVQSYTSYATTSYTSNYGNFGYAVTRDYSWAGARAGDALTTLFSGNAAETNIVNAWNSLNCW
jgi:hypothetical protein